MAAHLPKPAIPADTPQMVLAFTTSMDSTVPCRVLPAKPSRRLPAGPVTCAHPLAGLLPEPVPVPCKHCTAPTAKSLSAPRSHRSLCRHKRPFLAELLWWLPCRMVPEILSIKAFSSGALCRHVRWTAFSRGAGLTIEPGEAV